MKDLCRVAAHPELRALHGRLRGHLKQQKTQWPHFAYASGYFYQSLDEIRVSGVRPTDRRFDAYGLRELLRSDQEVLDIGANAGFMAILMSRYVKSVDAVEWNPYQVAIGRDVVGYLRITNVKFIEKSFQDLKPANRYDVITSFANHTTVDGGMKEGNLRSYFEHLHAMLRDDGLLAFESHNWDVRDPTFNDTIGQLGDLLDCLDERYFEPGVLGRGPRLYYVFRKR